MGRKKKTWPIEEIEKLAEDSDGIIKVAAKVLGCTRKTLLRYLDDTPEARAAFDAANEAALDESESVIMRLRRSNDPRVQMEAAKFHLRTKGRHRGYGDRQQIDLNELIPDGFDVRRHEPISTNGHAKNGVRNN